MGVALTIILGLMGIALGLALNWIIWFVLMPILYRQLRDQFRIVRARRNSH